jgi:hypothetical protein
MNYNGIFFQHRRKQKQYDEYPFAEKFLQTGIFQGYIRRCGKSLNRWKINCRSCGKSPAECTA